MSTETTDLKVITKALEDKIDGLATKINDDKATKTDFNELQKQLLNLKATYIAREEDDEREMKKYKRAGWTNKMRRQWAGEMFKALDRDNCWKRADDPKLAKELLQKAAGDISEYDATGGLGMLQTLVDPMIHKLIPIYGVGRSNARVIPGVRGSLNLNRLTAYPTFGRTVTTGAIRDDATVTPDNPTFTKINIQPAQSSGISVITEKLIYDAIPGVLEDVADDLAISAGLAEDTELFLGDGTATYNGFTGLKTATIGYNNGTVAVRTNSFTNFDPLLQCQQFVYPAIVRSPNCKYHMTPQTFALLQTFKASTSGLYFFDLSTNTWRVSGVPIEFNMVMDNPDSDATTFAIGKVPVIYGDMRRAVTMALGRDYQLRTLLELYAANNEIGLRLTYDFAYGLILPAAITRIAVVS